MVKFLRFSTVEGERILNVEACDIVKLIDVNTIQIFPVPFIQGVIEWSISRDGVNGVDFDGALVDRINDAIIRAEQTSYSQVMIDVVVPSKYAIKDILST